MSTHLSSTQHTHTRGCSSFLTPQKLSTLVRLNYFKAHKLVLKVKVLSGKKFLGCKYSILYNHHKTKYLALKTWLYHIHAPSITN